MSVVELNLDGLVGPTHNYAGLSYGNLASSRHKNQISNPRQAALQGLEKMELLRSLGVEQAILPPHFRPCLPFLRDCGFTGSTESILAEVATASPILLAASYSAAAMWTANAATVSPSFDSADQKLHITPANLNSGIHRFIEAAATTRVLKTIFRGQEFRVHDPLPSAAAFSDEGAANHMRLTPEHSQSGIEIFVYGRDPFDETGDMTNRFPARQSLTASQSIARTHQLDPAATLFVRQNPQAIDAGSFHNDVVAVANENVLLCHESAFADQPAVIQALESKYESRFDSPLHVIQIGEKQLPLNEAVQCYLFNSQIVTLENRKMVLIAPVDCQENEKAVKVIQELTAGDNPIVDAHFPDVRQSMMNGGGPACLRLRVVLSDSQLDSVNPSFRLTAKLSSELKAWIERHYRSELSVEDLVHPDLYHENLQAFQELSEILNVPRELFTHSD